eukprot:762708-Hanusia_phi.AAC.11
MEGGSKPHWKATLSFEEARDIYSKRPQGKSDSALIISSTVLSNRYNISPKAVRDIWNKRTWIKATQSMWTREEFAMFVEKASKKQAKKPGRPVGAKDTKPRKKRSCHQHSMDDQSLVYIKREDDAKLLDQTSYPMVDRLISPLNNEEEPSSSVPFGGYFDDDSEKKSHDPTNSCTICEALNIFSDVGTEQPSLQNHGHIIELFDHCKQIQDPQEPIEDGEYSAGSELRNIDINVGYPISLTTEYLPMHEI